MVWPFCRLCKRVGKKTDCCEAPKGAAGKLEAIILAGTMLRNTNWEKNISKADNSDWW
uniref:IncF plasmid conjugative transfer protein TraN n=1 Tax=Klebsiella pneumoniae TaxID=573 RepID=A0A8B0SP53_KLEPN|nr:IncF plasmid conjugative transfer protein TraN [Klebsiella pneumoniae]